MTDREESLSDPDAEILGRLIGDLESHGQDAVHDYVREYPHLEARIRELVRMQATLDASRPEDHDLVPSKLGEFRLVRLIARGGMGEVYEAIQERLDRRVAVKIIRRGRISPQARERFLREQAVLARLHQTHIVPIHTTGEEGPLQYFAMQYVDGVALQHVVNWVATHHFATTDLDTPRLRDIAAILAQSREEVALPERDGDQATISPAIAPTPSHSETGGPTSSNPVGSIHQGVSDVRPRLSMRYLQSTVRVMADAADAIHHAHSVGILHRDVKPSNIMIDTGGQCWIIDFGLAGKLAGDILRPDCPAEILHPLLTSTGVLGTPRYMSPEQFDGKADVRTDVWGLGATLYELLTTRRAFDGPNQSAVRENILNYPPTPPEKFTRNIPPDLSAICRKALQKSPSDRYPSAQDFGDDLRRWLRQEPVCARPAYLPRRMWMWSKRNKGWAAAIVAMTLIFFSGVIFWLRLAQLNAAAALARENEARGQTIFEQFQRLRLTARSNGWREAALAHANQLPQERRASLKDQMGAVLHGLDAENILRLKNTGGSKTVFDRSAQTLLIGGLNDLSVTKEGLIQPVTPAHVYDLRTQQVTLVSKHMGGGPVAFQESGRPVQVLAKDSQTIWYWDMTDQKLLREFRLPGQTAAEPLKPQNYPLMALSSDGSILAGAPTSVEKKERSLTIWDCQSGEVLVSIPNCCECVAFSPNGSILAASNGDGQIQLWSPKAQAHLLTLETGGGAVQSIALSPNCTTQINASAIERLAGRIAVAHNGGSIVLWDLSTRLPLAQCHGSSFQILAIAFSPDGMLLAASGRFTSKIWDAATGHHVLDLESTDYAAGLAFSHDGRQLAISGLGTTAMVDVWKLHDGRGLQTLRGLIGQIAKVRFSSNGELVAAVSHGWKVGVWDRKAERLLHVFQAPRGYFADNAAVSFSPDNRWLAYSAHDSANIWEIGTGREVRSWKLEPGLCDVLTFNDEGKLISFRTETSDGKPPFSNHHFEIHPRVCRLRELPLDGAPHLIKEVTAFNVHVYISAGSRNGELFVAWGISATPEKRIQGVKVYDHVGRVVWEKQDARLASDKFDTSGRIIALHDPSREHGVTLVDVPAGKVFGQFCGHCGDIGPKASYRAARHTPPVFGVDLYRGLERTPLITLGLDVQPSSVVNEFSSDGTCLAWGNADGTVTVADLHEIERQLVAAGIGW